jgi:hypothetical protein
MQYLNASLDSLDRRDGNGASSSTDDWLDSTSIFHNQWGSAAATTFNPSEVDGGVSPDFRSRTEKFEELYELHNGKGERSRKSDIRQSHIVNDANLFMSRLELPEPERERVLTILDDMDISSHNFGSRRYEKIILALCSLISDELLSNQPDPSLDDRLFLTDEFEQLMESTDMSSRELRQIRAKIRQSSDYF